MHLFPVFVLGDKVGLLISFRLIQTGLHMSLEVTQYQMVLFLFGVVGEVETIRHLMRKMIPEGHELLIIVADFVWAVHGLTAGAATLDGAGLGAGGAAATGPANGPPRGTFMVTLV